MKHFSLSGFLIGIGFGIIFSLLFIYLFYSTPRVDRLIKNASDEIIINEAIDRGLISNNDINIKDKLLD